MMNRLPLININDMYNDNGGFVYDDSKVKNHTLFFSAHMAYWSNGKKFAKSIVKAYNKGYKYFYGLEE